MAHPFGDLLNQYRARKHGLTQARLARRAGYDPPLVTKLCQGRKELTGPSGRERVVRLMGVLRDEGVLVTLEEANALLASAQLPPLFPGQPEEAALIQRLRGPNPPPPSRGSRPEESREASREGPARGGGAQVPTNLPAQLTHFVGREREVAEVRRLLGAHRLLTLTGAGGVGKTRLAIEVGLALVAGEAGTAAFADGVWLAELAPLADAALVPRAVAEAFRLPDAPVRTPAAALATHLAGKHALLILDNCEHVIAACAELVEALLGACPHLAILATSREALRAAGEVVWRVPSLTTPDPAHPPPLERVLDYEATQLFVEHAAAAQPGFELTPEGAAALAQVCHRLDGIPLAIEMAAAQVAGLSVAEVAARLDDRFALLTSGRRAALPRQQTLRATLEWSYQLLSASERVLLARLAVFADGCTAEAAQAVCADAANTAGTASPPLPSSPSPLLTHGGFGPGDVLPLLLDLVRKSLVVADARGGAGTGPTRRTRFHLLETVRQFALGKLNELGETDAMYERLAAFLLARPGPAAHGVHGRAATAGLDQVEAELGNVRALMAWARARPDEGALSLRLAIALSGVWVYRGHLAEPQAWLEETLARGEAVSADLRVGALNGLLRLLYYRGYNLARWAAPAEESLALSPQIDDASERFESLFWAGLAALHRSDTRRAEALLEEGLAFAQQGEYSHGEYASLEGLALVRLRQGDHPSATSLLRQSLQVAREVNNETDVRITLLLLPAVDQRAALALCEREVALCRAGDNPEGLASTLQIYAQSLLAVGETAWARDTLEECLALWRTLGVRWNGGGGMARTLLDLGQAAWLQGDPATARARFEESLEQYRHVGDARQTARLQVLAGYTRLAQGDVTGASATFGQGLALFRELGHWDGLDLALAGVGALAEARGQDERATRLFAAAAVPPPVLFPDWPADRIIFEREVAAARQRYDSPAFAAAWAEGQAMTMDQAVAYALHAGKEDEPPTG
jgi:predicted ATPase